MWIETSIGVVVMVLLVTMKRELDEIRTWWKQEKKFNQKRRW